MYLVGDIGNSEIKVCLVNSKKLIIKRINFTSKNMSLKKIKSNLNSLNGYYSNIDKILFCSVVPKIFKLIKLYFKIKTHIRCFEIKDLDLSSLLKIKVKYKQVGSDRIANSISVVKNKKNFIIIDLGTATTFDVLLGKSYVGGIIAPGIKISLNTLSDNATLIPKINLKKIKKIIGKDTKSAVRSGFFWGYAGLIDNIINLVKKETRKSFKVIITGGFSKLIKNPIKTNVVEDKNITLKGLIKTLELIK